MTDTYLFGDSDLAARRLRLVAEVFAATSREFMILAAARCPSLAVELGCGPGHTTHLLADALACRQVVGLDSSDHFIALAGKTATAQVSFRLHDATTVPFPVGPCDVIYARFLLTHLVEPDALIATWATQLRPGGRLLVEEADSIDTAEPALETYLSIAEATLRDGGCDLYVGRWLGAMQTPGVLATRLNRVVSLPLTNHLAAKMFSLNIRTWKHSAFVQENYSSATIRQLEDDLAALAAAPTDQKGIQWRLRQLALERTR